MKLHWLFSLAAVVVISAGCGTSKPTASGLVYEGKHVSEWGDAAKSSDPKARLEAAKVLAKMGKEGKNANQAIPGLQVALQDEDPAIRGWAAVAMVNAARGTPFPVGPLVMPKLKEAAESSDKELSSEASQILKGMPPPAPSGPPGQRGGRGGAEDASKDKESAGDKEPAKDKEGAKDKEPAKDEGPAKDKKADPKEGKDEKPPRP